MDISGTDTDGRVFGISRRFRDGSKAMLKRSRPTRRGLMIAVDAPSQHVYCVEGASDTAVLVDERLKVIGRPSNAGGAGLLVDWLRQNPQRPGQTFYIVGEDDRNPTGWPGMKGSLSIAEKLTAALPELSVRIAFAGDGAVNDRIKDVRHWKLRYPDGDLLESLLTYTVDEAEDLSRVVGGAK